MEKNFVVTFFKNVKFNIFHLFFPEFQLPNWISANHCKYLHVHSEQGQRQHLPTKVPHIFLKMYLTVILADLTLRLFLAWPPQLLERAATAWQLLG